MKKDFKDLAELILIIAWLLAGISIIALIFVISIHLIIKFW